MLNHWNRKGLNTWIPMKDRLVPFERMIYLGDGDTDIPAMKTVMTQKGTSIGVFDNEEWENEKENIYKLVVEDRVKYVAPADYSEGSQLDIIVKGVLERIMSENK